MKIATNNSTVSTNNNNAVSYDFNIGDVSTIIEILRNRLYSNPIQTLTQEYLSNARDSHREANRADKPIRVTLPTKIDSSIKIRDYGVGLSRDRVREVFVNYGISTKRKDNQQTGGFGLGAKSAWAYTDSFVVVSYYNGICSTYVAHTGRSSNGTFELVNEVETNEPNGVEVQIPVKETDIQRFINAVYRTTYFWEVRPELHGITDIEIPNEFANPNFKYHKNNLVIMPASDFLENLFETKYVTHKAFVLIDKIPYGISKFQYSLENLKKLSGVVHPNNLTFIEVNNGDIDVAASREEVANDAGNIAKLETVCEGAITNIWEIVRSEFDVKFENLSSYMNVYGKLKNTFTFNHIPKDLIKLEYSYEDVTFEMHGLNFYVKCDKFTKISYYFEEEQDTRNVIRCKNDEKTVRITEEDKIVIVDCEYSDIIKKRKAKKLISQGADHVYFVSCDPAYSSKLKKCANAFLLSEVNHDKISYVAKKRIEGVIGIRALALEHGRNGYRVETNAKEDISLTTMENNGENYILVPNSDEEKYDFRNANFVKMVSYLKNNDWTVIKCNKGDYEKVISLDNVSKYDDVVDDLESFVPVSDEQIETNVFHHMNQSLFNLRAYAEKIECPKIKELFSLYPKEIRNRKYVEETIIRKYKHYKIAFQRFERTQKIEEDIIAKYPLLEINYYGRANVLKELVYYINNKFQTEYSKEA
jgi:hypothetical protein